jgi:hypothetical protein
MNALIGIIHSAFVFLIVACGIIYPQCRTWSAWSIGMILWHSALSLLLANRPVLEAGRIAGHFVNALCLIFSVVALVGYAAGHEWCLLISLGAMLCASLVTYLIVTAVVFRQEAT